MCEWCDVTKHTTKHNPPHTPVKNDSYRHKIRNRSAPSEDVDLNLFHCNMNKTLQNKGCGSGIEGLRSHPGGL